jgi:6-phosphogluconolactonase/glucosamine-6-phosphate isomerase/deaminase
MLNFIHGNSHLFRFKETGIAAGENAALQMKHAIKQNGVANIIMATGASQFDLLQHLVTEKTIDWSKVIMFHLDEYLDLPETHIASFRKYLKERFLNLVHPLQQVYLINAEADAVKECEKLNRLSGSIQSMWRWLESVRTAILLSTIPLQILIQMIHILLWRLIKLAVSNR